MRSYVLVMVLAWVLVHAFQYRVYASMETSVFSMVFSTENLDRIWNNFSGCKCLKSILIRSGFENIASLKLINSETLINLEKYVESNRSITDDITCEHSKAYATTSSTTSATSTLCKSWFKFLPGHWAILLDWCQNSLKNDIPDIRTNEFKVDNPAFSPLFRELISDALYNHQKPDNSYRFSKLVMEFSIYIYIMGGRASYDILCANLPLPKTGAIGMLASWHASWLAHGLA